MKQRLQNHRNARRWLKKVTRQIWRIKIRYALSRFEEQQRARQFTSPEYSPANIFK